MKNKKQSQSGSSHLILIIASIFLLLGLLGFLFWQNFIKPKTISEGIDVALTEIAYDKTTNSGLAIKYPKSWILDNKISNRKDDTTITSPDGSVSVSMLAFDWKDLMVDGGVYGRCDGGITKDGSIDYWKITQIDTADIAGYPNARFVSYVLEAKDGGLYKYYSEAQIKDEKTLNMKVGDAQTCSYPSNIANRGSFDLILSIILKDVNKTSNEFDNLEDFKKATETNNYKIAKRIIQSLYKKD